MSAPSSISRRAFLRTASAAGALSLASTGCRNDNPGRDTLAKILVVGGGAAGLAVAAKLRRDLPRATVMLAEPSARHACQPLLPLVALGLVPAGRIWRDTAGLVPAGVQWIPDAVSRVDVPRNEAVLAKGPRIRYDFLVLAPGVQRNWDALPGSSRAALGEHGIHSVHDREGVARTALPMLFDFMKRRGFDTVCVQVRPDNAASLALHASLGFHETARDAQSVTLTLSLS